ncbi:MULTISPECIES: DUF423 domain-containing protein [unclassified Roseibium]|uniref:DUF423 domain-containing protein n=1 Tax=unclassified Roseibium TaxID=2629323 RepID=UPI00273FA0DC|nr:MULTISPECIES: DUF423 domain-containing protein [unclassified Roseibium]
MSDATSKLLRLGVIIGGLSGASGVAVLALSAHADTTGLMKTAAHMLLFHAPVFLGMGLVAQIRRVPFLPVAFALMVVGITLFSGDLIARATIGNRLFPMAAPTGGLLTIASLIALALSAIQIHPKINRSGPISH